MSSVPQNRPIVSPLETRPGIGINGRERGADRRGGIRLANDLAERADGVRDSAEISDEAWARHQATEHVRNQGVLSKAHEISFLTIAFQTAILRGYMQGAQSVLNKFAAARQGSQAAGERGAGSMPQPAAGFTDTGDGLGLPVAAHNGVEGDLASEGERPDTRPFILSGPTQVEMGPTFRQFTVTTSMLPSQADLRGMQISLGFDPAGYGDPRNLHTKRENGTFITTWCCDRSCD